MTKMKKLVSLVLAALMLVGMMNVAWAENTPAKNDSITIDSAKVGETYKIYKLFDLVVDNETDPKKYSYTVNADWTAFFEDKDYITIENGYVTGFKVDAAVLAKAAEDWASKPAALKEVLVAEGATTAEFTGLADGYYLITSTLGTLAMTETTPDKNAVTITEKNPEDTIKKEVQEDNGGTWGSSNDAQIGDTVNFKSTATLKPNTRNVKIYDIMDSGLTCKDDVAIEGLTKDTDYSVAYDVTEGEKTYDFVITFTETYLDGLTESTDLVITYSATLNEKVITSTPDIDDQVNKTKITYGDKQSVENTTTTTTRKFTVNKFATDVENLAGAEFSLKKGDEIVKLIKINDTNYRVANANEEGQDTFITVDTGDITILGVDSDKDYKLVEIKAPEGYNKLAGEITVEVSADNALKVDVENKTGNELPSTGGIGTTIFYAVGGLLVVLAVVLLVTKRRVGEEN